MGMCGKVCEIYRNVSFCRKVGGKCAECTHYSFDTGVHVAIPKGYFGKIESKSGLNAKHGLTCTGVIDSGYTGSIAVILHNGGRDVVQIKHGQKIGQLLIQPVEHPDLVLVDKLEDTERGSGGFGSSGEF